MRLSLGSWEDNFDTSVNFRDIENEHGDYTVALVWACRQRVLSRTTGYSRSMGKGDSRIISLYEKI